MGLCLIAALNLELLIVILEVAAALGAVIFVHELGHFVVAKLCGVRCEKFYLGFDIGGLKICKFRWGETEYGIGILPLGGYVKMLGQEDNPARLREEIERAKQQATVKADEQGEQPSPPAPLPSTGEGSTQSQVGEGNNNVDVAAAEQALYNPRSYLAKSVPQRIAIISAGVIMNVIFAFITAVIAYRLGVRQNKPAIGAVMPGRPAWRMGFRPGDYIEEIGGVKIEKYTDLQRRVSLGDAPPEGISVVLRRPTPDGQEKRLELKVHPTRGGLAPTIGIFNRPTTTLAEKGAVAIPGSAASKAKPPLENGDRIVKMGDESIDSYAEMHSYLATHAKLPLEITVERTGKPVVVTVPENRMQTLGLMMEMGPVRAVEEGSPADAAGLRRDDVIVGFADAPGGSPQAIDDPLRWPSQLNELAGKTIELLVKREGEAAPRRVPVALRDATWYEQPMAPGNSMSVPALGVAYRVLNRVQGVVADSPAAKAGVKQGDIITKAVVRPPKEQPKDQDLKQKEVTVEFSDKEPNWPFLSYQLQDVRPGTEVVLSREEGDDVTLEPKAADGWFDPERGFRLEPDTFIERGETWGEAMRLGARDTWDALTMVVAFIRKLSDGTISLRGLGGPITIASAAGHAAYQGPAELLLFLTMLGANLAVLNILPIPLLDGGHIIFLLYEWIRGKPADERVQLALTYVGLAMLLALMVLVFGLDLHLISRNVPVLD